MALKMYGPSATTGMDFDSSTAAIPNICHGCKLGKSTCKPFSGSGKKMSWIFEVVHGNLTFLKQTKLIQGSTYFATFIDDHSHHVVVYFLRLKDHFVSVLEKFLAWGETQTSLKLSALHLDRGGEYVAGTVIEMLDEKGIECHLTMPGSPQQNGKAEQFSQTIMDKALAMVHTSGLTTGFWEYAVNAAVHVYNYTPTRMLGWCMPFELWNSGQILDVSHLHIFRCLGYMHVPDYKHHKLDVKVIKVVLVGYELGSKGYQLWDRHTHSLRLSWDVTFDESVFPFLQGAKPHPAPESPAPISAQAPIIISPSSIHCA